MDHQIASQLQCSMGLVQKTRLKAQQRGPIEALKHTPQQNRKPRKLDGAAEAHLTTLACSQAPEGRKRWTLQLLADQLIAMQIVDNISDTTVYRIMKKTI